MAKKVKTKALINKLKPYWAKLDDLETEYYEKVSKLEKVMQKALKINDLEFFMCEEGYYAGIGTADRKLKLIHSHELEGDEE